MAHTCPDCGQYCHCRGDIDDIDFGERDDCEHYKECEQETEAADEDFE